MSKKYIAEFVGTFTLAFAVLAAVAYRGDLPMAVPLIAALVVGIFVYTIGPISGCHLNPSVTLGLLSVKKISSQESVGYIASQIAGAVLAVIMARVFWIMSPVATVGFDGVVFLAEMLGAFFLNFGIASVVYGKVKDQMSGIVIGGSLLMGIIVAVLAGASGILNPAVAIALNAANVLHILAPIAGSILAYNLYRYIATDK